MSAAFLACLAFTLAPAQDGQRLHVTPGDPGGATDDGITLATFREYCGDPTLSPADLGRITDAQVQAIYATKFWNPVRGDDLPVAIALMVMDHAVNCGPTPSGRLLQQAIGLRGANVDGWIGPQSIAAVGRADVSALLNRLNAEQAAYYRGCRGFGAFGHGWLLRLGRRLAAAEKLLGGHDVPAPVALTTDDLNQDQLAKLAAR